MITVNDYPIDVVLTLKRSRKSEVSKFPVERGSNRNDNIRTDEPDLQFEGMISDTPTGAVALHPSRQTGGTPSIDALQFLDRLQAAEDPVVVQCSLGRFDQMAITSVDVSRDVKTRKGLKLSLSFSRMRIEDLTRTTVVVSASGPADFGLSIDKLRDGSHLLWRKGKPPGSSPATDPPGVIIGKEVVECRNKNIFHQSGKALSNEESHDLLLDMRRDSSIFEQRGIARIEQRNEAAGKRIDNMQRLLDKKNREAHPGQRVDPAVMGR